MAKDTFYFSHDFNSRQDEKIKRLIRKHKMCGYGIFWSIIEDLYNNANALRLDYDGIAFDLHSDVETVKSIIHDFGLFIFNDETFGSLSIQRRIEERDAKSKKARESAYCRWNNANALQTQSDSNAIKKGNKGKEINKEKDEFLIFRKSELEQLRNDIFEKLKKYGLTEPIIYSGKKVPIEYYDLVEFIIECIDNEEWKLNLKTRFGNTKFELAMKDFINKIKTDMEYLSYENTSDFQRHFSNWLNKNYDKYGK